MPEGITSLQVPVFTLYRPGYVTGAVSLGQASQLVLAGPGGKEDSIVLQAGQHPFRLRCRPRQVGQFMYTLRLQQGDVSKEEPLPINVVEPTPLRVAILETAPTAEVRMLKDFLSQHNHRVAWRYQLGRQNYGFAFLNTPSFSMGTIREDWLASQDVLMLDAQSAKTATEGERKAILDAVRKGLGVVLLGTGKEHPSWLLPAKVASIEGDTVHIAASSGRTISLPVLPVRVDGDGLYPLQTQGGRVLSGYRRTGKGLIGYTLWQETYRLQTAGDEELYASMWNELMTTVARPSDVPEVRIENSFPIVRGERLSIEVLGDVNTLKLDSSRVPLDEDPVVDNLLHAGVPAPEPGWHDLVAGAHHVPFAVMADTSWAALQLHKRHALNLLVAQGAGSGTLAREEREVPLWIACVVFLFAGGILWLAGKL